MSFYAALEGQRDKSLIEVTLSEAQPDIATAIKAARALLRDFRNKPRPGELADVKQIGWNVYTDDAVAAAKSKMVPTPRSPTADRPPTGGDEHGQSMWRFAQTLNAG